MHTIDFTNSIRGRDIHTKVIPTVCNLKNMLTKLTDAGGDVSQLKPWEMRSYKGYNIEPIKHLLLTSPNEDTTITTIKNHILDGFPEDFGANVIDIYLVGMVSTKMGIGREFLFDYLERQGVTNSHGSKSAIRQVGLGDGKFLRILNNDGTIRDTEFFRKLLGPA